MINNAYDFLIATTAGLVDGYSETLPAKGKAVVYRLIGGITSKTLSKNRQYTTYQFNALVRGGKDSSELSQLCDDMVLVLDLNGTGIIQCNVTNEPQYAYKDDNGNLHYTFTVEVLI